MALFPLPPNSRQSPTHFSATSPHPRKQISGHFIRNFMRVFSEFWKLAIRDDTKKHLKNTNVVGEAHCMPAFLRGG